MALIHSQSLCTSSHSSRTASPGQSNDPESGTTAKTGEGTSAGEEVSLFACSGERVVTRVPQHDAVSHGL